MVEQIAATGSAAAAQQVVETPARSARPAAVQAEPKAGFRVQADLSAAEVAEREPARELSEPQSDALKTAFAGINKVMDRFSKSIKFAVYEDSGSLYAQVINTDTEEVIKTIPSEEALEMMSRVNYVLGMLIDEKG